MKHIRCSTYLRDNFLVDSVELLIKYDFSGEETKKWLLTNQKEL